MTNKLLRKNATTLVLVGAALTLSAYVLLVDRGTQSTDEAAARKHSLLPIFRDQQVDEIELTIGNRRAILTRHAVETNSGPQSKGENAPGQQSYHWRIEIDGSTAPADDESVADLIRGLKGAQRLRDVPESVETSTTGLDEPKVRVTIHMGSVSYRVLLGKRAATPKGAVYAKVEGHGVSVIDKKFVSSIAKSVDAYRSRRIVSLLMDDVADISVHHDGHGLILQRTPWGFRVGDAQGPRAAPTMVDRITEAMADMTAKAFLPNKTAERLVSGDSHAVTLHLSPITKAGKPVRIRLGGTCPREFMPDEHKRWIVAFRTQPSPMGACVPRSVRDPLLPSPSSFVDTKLLAAKLSEVESVIVQQKDKVLEIGRRGRGWHQQRPSDRDLTADEGDSFVKGLLHLEGEWSPSEHAPTIDWNTPAAKVDIQLAAPRGKPRPRQRLLVSSPRKQRVWVKRLQDGALIAIDRQDARLLRASPLLLKSVQLMNSAAVHVRSVRIDLQGEQFQSVERTENSFRLTYPPGYDVDAALTTDLFSNLAQLRAVRWVAERDDGSFGFARPWATVSFTISEDGRTTSKKMLIGAPSRDGRYGRWEPSTGVFVISKGLVNQLSRYVIDRSPFMVDPTIVKSLEIRAGHEHFTVSLDGDTWTVRIGKGGQDSMALPEKAREALMSLRSEGVVHVGAPHKSEGLDRPLLTVKVIPRPGPNARAQVWHVGKGDVWRKVNMFYARMDGIDATFALPRSQVSQVLEALGVDETAHR